MTEESDSRTDHHLQEALRHLSEVERDDLRKTNAVALEQVTDTIAMVLREHREDE